MKMIDAIYLLEFDNSYTLFDTWSSNESILYVFYRSKGGEMGFLSDYTSTQLYKEVLGKSIWYDHAGCMFRYLDVVSNLYAINGLVLDNDLFGAQIDLQIERQKKVKQNKLLTRYNLSFKEVESNLLSDFYLGSNKFSEASFRTLSDISPDIAIAAFAEGGRHLVISSESSFYHRICAGCHRLDVQIIKALNWSEVPSW